MKSIVGISRDHSGSMAGIHDAARKDYNATVRDISSASLENKIDTVLSTVTFGGSVTVELDNKQIALVDELKSYHCGGGTPLFRSLDRLIRLMQASPYARDPEASFIAMVVTDGQSTEYDGMPARVVADMKNLMATGRWSFVFRVPRGYARDFAQRYNVPLGNILEWDQTEYGVREATKVTAEAFRGYYAGVSKGVRSTSTFYKSDLNAAEVKKAIKTELVDISGEVTIAIATAHTEDWEIRDVIEKLMGVRYEKGGAFYQLTKYEKVIQPRKKVIVRDVKTGRVYAGDAARDLLGWRRDVNISASPGDHAGYEVFVQSTSYNRKIPVGAKCLWHAGSVL